MNDSRVLHEYLRFSFQGIKKKKKKHNFHLVFFNIKKKVT